MGEQPRPASAQQLMVLDSDPGRFVFGNWQNVLVCVWLQQAEVSDVRRLGKLVAPLVRQYAGGISSIHLIARSAGRPTAEARQEFIRIMKKHADNLACVAAVLGGSGFWASAMSSFITGMRVVSPWSFGFRVYSSIDDAVAWLGEPHFKKTSVRLEPAELAGVLKRAQTSSVPAE